MTYEEAKSLLSKVVPNPYYYRGEKWVAKIIPEIVNDRIPFIEDLNNKKVRDEDVIKYSSNNQFTVNGYKMKSFNS